LALPPATTSSAALRAGDGRSAVGDSSEQLAGRRWSDVEHYAAVQLFVARTRATGLDFAPTDENAATVAEICIRLDGLPLAIELAAARSKLFAPQALLARLDQRLNVLIGGARDLPERQQTLRRTIDWSYDLLDGGAQALFARLAVFVGGWTLEAAERVLTTEDRGLSEDVSDSVPSSQSSVLTGLALLVDNSLLKREQAVADEPRFVMLETIREYALVLLAASGEAQAMRERHARYFTALAERAEPELRGAAAAEWLDRLERERANLRAALVWCIDDTPAEPQTEDQVAASASARADARSEFGLRLSGALQLFWELRGPPSDGRALLAAVLARAPQGNGEQRAARARTLYAAGALAAYYDDFVAARAYFEQCLALYRELGDMSGSTTALLRLGGIAASMQEKAVARTLFEEALALFRAMGDRQGTAQALYKLGIYDWAHGDFARATARSEESLAIFRELGDLFSIAQNTSHLGVIARFVGEYARAEALLNQGLAVARDVGIMDLVVIALINLGHVALAQGEYARAEALLEQSLALAREREELLERISVAWSLRTLGTVACRQGKNERAAALHREALALYRDRNDGWGITECLEGLAATACAQADFAGAVRLLGVAAALRDATGYPMSCFDREEVERVTSVARAALDEVGFVAAFDAGRATPLEQAIAEALESTMYERGTITAAHSHSKKG
jgi:tetratricopeptide (TPR) repeat protein